MSVIALNKISLFLELEWAEIESGIKIAESCAFFKYDIGKEKVNDKIECARSCRDTPGCTHFNFYVSNGNCYKKRVSNIEKSDAYWKGRSVFCGILSKINTSIINCYFIDLKFDFIEQIV